MGNMSRIEKVDPEKMPSAGNMKLEDVLTFIL